MGCIISCCPTALSSVTRTFAEHTNHTNINLSTHFTSEARNRNNNNNNNNTSNDLCDICGIHLDPTLLDGHREVCRTNARRMHMLQEERQQRHFETRRASSEFGIRSLDVNDHVENNTSGDRWDNENDDKNFINYNRIRSNKDDNIYITHSVENERNELCVVCLDKPCEYAFLPCGHIVCCNTCAYMLETCPICRCPRTALCHVEQNTLSQFKCPHCRQFIAPTYFDGHREVCATRMRWKNREVEKIDKEEECSEVSQNEQESVVDINSRNDYTEEPKIVIGSRVNKFDKEVECYSQNQHELGMESLEETQQQNTNELNVGENVAYKNNINVNDSIKKISNETETAVHVSNNDYAKKMVDASIDKNSSKATNCANATSAAKRSECNETTNFNDGIGKTLRCVECNNLYHCLMLCLPCGHRVMCENCSNKRSRCPVCLQNITKVIKAYQ